MAKLMFFNSGACDDDTGIDTMMALVNDIDAEGTRTDETIEFKKHDVVNVERDEVNVTIYFDACGWYLVLSLEEWQKIIHADDVTEATLSKE